VAFVPRTKTPLQLAALTGALLIGFELVLTHWSWLYIPWFFPFVVFALLSNGRGDSIEGSAEGVREDGRAGEAHTASIGVA